MSIFATDNDKPGLIHNAFRKFFALLDRAVYGLLGIAYQLFFNIASADIFSTGSITKFYQRIQLIIGVFVMFQLAMTIIKGIVDPDSFTDSKSGAGNVVFRICTALAMLALIVPINISSASNEYEKQINNNGLLFGTLYSLQHRVLKNNTIGKLVMGVKDDSNNYVSGSDDEALDTTSRIFVSSVLRGFYRINLKSGTLKTQEGREADQINDNRVCTDIDDEVLKNYTKLDATPGDIVTTVNETCRANGKKRYAFTYMPLVSLVVGIIFVVLMLGFCIDIAVRAVKLAVLRLIAPIPIISYMDPKGGKDGAFNSWVKLLASTYLDLFIRVAAVYFVIFVIQEMIVSGVTMLKGGVLGVFTSIFIYIGLFYFAKEAPKFIKDALGIKGDGGSGLFSGFGNIMGLGAAGIGVVGSAATNWRAAKAENEALHKNQGLLNFGRNAASAIAGGIAGGAVGIGAAAGKDGGVKKVLDAQSARNARRASHSTLPGRIADSTYGMFTGQSLATKGNKTLEGAQGWVKAQGDWKSAIETEAKNNGRAVNLGGGITARYAELERAVASAHDGKVTIGGRDYDATMFTQDFMDDALKSQVRDYQADETHVKNYGTADAGTSYADNIKAGGKLYKKREDVISKVGDVDVAGLDPSIAQNFKNYNVDSVDTYGKAIGAANNVISNQENDMRQVMRRANNQQKK